MTGRGEGGTEEEEEECFRRLRNILQQLKLITVHSIVGIIISGMSK
jgi:hypothetical protein